MNNLIFLPEAWSDYVFWQKENKNVLRRINLILRDMQGMLSMGSGSRSRSGGT